MLYYSHGYLGKWGHVGVWCWTMYENYLSFQVIPQVSPMVPSGRGLLVVTKATFILMVYTDANERECLKHPKFSNLVRKNFQVLANQQQAHPMQISRRR